MLAGFSIFNLVGLSLRFVRSRLTSSSDDAMRCVENDGTKEGETLLRQI